MRIVFVLLSISFFPIEIFSAANDDHQYLILSDGLNFFSVERSIHDPKQELNPGATFSFEDLSQFSEYSNLFVVSFRDEPYFEIKEYKGIVVGQEIYLLYSNSFATVKHIYPHMGFMLVESLGGTFPIELHFTLSPEEVSAHLQNFESSYIDSLFRGEWSDPGFKALENCGIYGSLGRRIFLQDAFSSFTDFARSFTISSMLFFSTQL